MSSGAATLNEALDVSPLRPLHWKIWWLSAMGIFLDGFDLFIISVALPLIIAQYHISDTTTGLLAAAAVLGAMVGAWLGGHLTDRWGRKSIYVFDLAVFILFSLGTAFAWSIPALIFFRFLLGVGIGADYPICASYVSEFMPARVRGRMMIAAFSFQALGMLAAVVTGLIILTVNPTLDAWRWMLGIGAVPALVVMLARTTVPESARWYMEHGKPAKAAAVVGLIAPERKKELAEIIQHEIVYIEKGQEHHLGYATLFSKHYRRRTILAAVPWFLMDIAAYGIGIFTPIILTTLVIGHKTAGMDTVARDFGATKGAAFIDLFLLVGFALNIWLVDKLGRIRLQVIGFAGMAAGMGLLSIAGAQLDAHQTPSVVLVFAGFILFNVLMNMGPNSTTFILPAELFPTKIRASGHGFAAGAAKLGAACGLFLLPIFKAHYGIVATVVAMGLVSLVALMVTVATRIETAGRTLEELHPGDIPSK